MARSSHGNVIEVIADCQGTNCKLGGGGDFL